MVNCFSHIASNLVVHLQLVFKYSNSHFSFDKVTGKPIFFQELFSLAGENATRFED